MLSAMNNKPAYYFPRNISKKASSLQKMINLIYLIFITMMMMNLNREVLRAFHNTNETLKLRAHLVDDNNQLF